MIRWERRVKNIDEQPRNGRPPGMTFLPLSDGGPPEPLRAVVGKRLRDDASYFVAHPAEMEFFRSYVPGEFWPDPDPGTSDAPAQAVRVIRGEDGNRNRIPLARIYPVAADGLRGWWNTREE